MDASRTTPSSEPTEFFDAPDQQPIKDATGADQASQQEVTEEAMGSTTSTPVGQLAAAHRDNDDGDDNSSDTSMDTSDSREATPEPQDAYATAMTAADTNASAAAVADANATVTAAANHAGAKRKLSDVDPTDTAAADHSEAHSKKIKNEPDVADVPAVSNVTPTSSTNGLPYSDRPAVANRAIFPFSSDRSLPIWLWQRAFLNLSPMTLLKCKDACKAFRYYLTGIKVAKKDPTDDRLDSDSIWTQSRKNYFPSLPKPLARFSDSPVPELEMLKLLVYSNYCQFCHKRGQPATVSTHLNAGPGQNGVRVVWPFGICSCGPCLKDRTKSDIEIMTGGVSPQLRLGIPHGFLSPDLQFATESLRQTAGVPGQMGSMRFSKIFYRSDWDAICHEQRTAQALGDGAAEEWSKGLDAEGKKHMTDSARWEKWELQLRPGSNLHQTLREYDLSSSQSGSKGAPQALSSMTANGANAAAGTITSGTHPLPQPVHVFHNGYGPQYPAVQPQLPAPFQQRPVRNPHEIEMARQARRAEIERRCREQLSLEPNVLQHMESFRNAMQMVRPLADPEWELLKQRLLQQRDAAEAAEHQRLSQLAALQATVPASLSENATSRPVRDTHEIDYEVAQAPLRQLLREYADDIINADWRGGQLVTKDSAPIFAVRVLLGVHQRFKSADQNGSLSQMLPPHLLCHQGDETPRPFLSLENMKWVFDHAVKPLTDPYTRGLFVCARSSDCTEETKPRKWFPFEGLIQHYGAKHTDDFSKDNVVVHWQSAMWPEDPPFDDHPEQYLKPERKASSTGSNQHARNTPQRSHAKSTISSNLNSQSYQEGSNGIPAVSSSYGSGTFPAQSQPANGYLHSQQASVEAISDVASEGQIIKLLEDAREIWDALQGIKGLENSARMQALVHHVVNRFVSRCGRRPEIAEMSTALTSNSHRDIIRPVKNVPDLCCKVCIAGDLSVPKDATYYGRIRGKDTRNLKDLLRHFQIVHQAGGQTSFLNWAKDMIEVPGDHTMAELMRAPGMDDRKLALIAQAFPSAFPARLPTIGVVTEDSTQDDLASSLLSRLNKKPKPPKKKGRKGANGGLKRDSSREPAVERESSQEPLPEPTEDQYDPRRPMIMDSSQFQAHAAGRAHPPLAMQAPLDMQAPPAVANLNAADIEAVLRSLNAHPAQPAVPKYDERSRSPSVGRDVSPPKPSTTGSSVTAQPDIAAILAALQGQGAVEGNTAPPTTASAPRQGYADAAHRPQSEQFGGHRSETIHPTSRYGHAPQPALSGTDAQGVQELQAALSQNSRHFAQNHQPAYAESPPYGPHAGYSTARYAHESDQHRGQPPAHLPVYREPHVQYVQLPRPEHEYQYERPAPAQKTIVIDQYGNPIELIPVDPAPTPLAQYGHQYPEQPVYHSTMPPDARFQPVYEERRPVYHPAHYAYDDGRP